ncbi:hypothetical protein GOODEAATRI_018257 [Goodea atripinnis]|uniref:Uncharacterized protein n=1 Tax=Goodea atripinnis TaxID=208336 RepID=A0ABV0PPM0_9TELE
MDLPALSRASTSAKDVIESDDCNGSALDSLTDPRPPSSSSARKSVRLASNLRANGIFPGSDLEPSHLAQLTDLLPDQDSSPSPPPQPSSLPKKHIKKSANSPAKRCRPPSISASTVAPPGFPTAAASSPVGSTP